VLLDACYNAVMLIFDLCLEIFFVLINFQYVMSATVALIKFCLYFLSFSMFWAASFVEHCSSAIGQCNELMIELTTQLSCLY